MRLGLGPELLPRRRHFNNKRLNQFETKQKEVELKNLGKIEFEV